MASWPNGSKATRGRAPSACVQRSIRAPRLPVSSCVTRATPRPLPAPRAAVSRSASALSASSQPSALTMAPSRRCGPAKRSGWYSPWSAAWPRMQRPPRFTGWSGLPSSFTTRPSRLRARTPQPAGHSRHTVANHAATPGTRCSLGTTSGRIVSVACWQPPAAAAAPVVATILKKSRRFISTWGGSGAAPPHTPHRESSPAHGSVVTRDAVQRRAGLARRVPLAMAVHAPAHRHRRRRRAESGHVEEVVGERRPRARRHRGHRLHGAVTRLAGHAEAHVGLVREVRELGQLVDAQPRDWLALGPVLGQLLDLGAVGGGGVVVADAPLHRRQPRVLGAAGRGGGGLAGALFPLHAGGVWGGGRPGRPPRRRPPGGPARPTAAGQGRQRES